MRSDTPITAPHTRTVETITKLLRTDPDSGLNLEEVPPRLNRWGENAIPEDAPIKPWRLFLDQFWDPIIAILSVAALLAFIFKDTWEGTAIVVVIGISVAIGFFMERKAYRTLNALRKMGQAQTSVRRSGAKQKIRVSRLVPGDLVLFGPGDVIPADLRLVSGEQLSLKESALTGESIPVPKRDGILETAAPLGKRRNMLWKGTTVLTGSGRGLVVATGAQTELGRIQQLGIQSRSDLTPLERKLRSLSIHLIWLTIGLALIIGLLGYLRGANLVHMIETALALSIAAIPEGLPVVATIALARGMLRLSRREVIVKDLEAIQTLGATDVILTDKTGTLTEDSLQAHSLLLGPSPDTTYAVARDSDKPRAEQASKLTFDMLVKAAILCNNVKTGDAEVSGDTLEVALLKFAEQEGLNADQLREEYPEIWELPFEPKRKYMLTLHRTAEGYVLFAKGAFEVIEELCSDVLSDAGAHAFEDRVAWRQKVKELASSGLRTLAFAYKTFSQKPDTTKSMRGLTFLGAMGFLDPPRADVRPLFEIYRRAGIRVVMVTGDHPETARKIGEEVGLLAPGAPESRVVHGADLVEAPALHQTRIFARILPEGKLDLVRRYQEEGHVVGMIGDGINDVPALRKADIGIAMGIRGTEAAREASDVILKHDSFSAIELAIRQGRVVFANIRQFVVYLLSCNLAEILIVALAALSNLPAPLLPMQILFLNLVTDVFPALALGLGKGEADIMNRPPRNPGRPVLERKDWGQIIAYGLGISLAVLGSAIYGRYAMALPSEWINNLAFYTLVIAQLVHVLNIPDFGTSFFRNEVIRNPYVWGAIGLSLAITTLAYALPAVAKALGLARISLTVLIVSIGFGLGSLFLIQAYKVLWQKLGKHPRNSGGLPEV